MDYLKTLLESLRQAEDYSSCDRVRISAYAKHGCVPEFSVTEGMDLNSLAFEIEEALQNAARWQAIVDTGRAIFDEQ